MQRLRAPMQVLMWVAAVALANAHGKVHPAHRGTSYLSREDRLIRLDGLADRLASLSQRDLSIVVREAALLTVSATLHSWDTYVVPSATRHDLGQFVCDDSAAFLHPSTPNSFLEVDESSNVPVSCSCEKYTCECDKGCQCQLTGETATRTKKARPIKDAFPAGLKGLASESQGPSNIDYQFKCGCSFDSEQDNVFDNMNCKCRSGGCKCRRLCTCDGEKGSEFRFVDHAELPVEDSRTASSGPPTGIVGHEKQLPSERGKADKVEHDVPSTPRVRRHLGRKQSEQLMLGPKRRR